MAKPKNHAGCSVRFEAVQLDALFPVLDAISWLDLPDVKQIAQFAGIDPRTAGKLLKNCFSIGIIQTDGAAKYSLKLPYPYKGSAEQKKAVNHDAFLIEFSNQSRREFFLAPSRSDRRLGENK